MTDATAPCGSVRERLSAYLDARLPEDQLVELRAHLGECADCGAERAALERLDGQLREAFADHPFGDAFVEELLVRLPGPPGGGRSRVAPRPAVGWGWAVAIAAVLLGALGLGLSLRSSESGGARDSEAGSPVLAFAGPGLLGLTPDGSGVPLAPGSPVRAGEHVVAVSTPPAHLRLPDGTRVDLHADTEAFLRREGSGTTLVLAGAEGKVFCEVAKRRAPFRVAARDLEVLVLGTRFLVEQRTRTSSVTVVEGRVLATARSGDRRTLVAGEQAEASSEGEGLLSLSRVVPRRHGLWVPRLAEEQRALERASSSPPLPTDGPREEPTNPPAPSDPPAPPSAGLDQPVAPPAYEQGDR
ncbi:MAG: hypothetical protein D6731_07780 [Planctomycetota bacterium]|nr:MAG: hypothetical protein D6731_07780 [Planctomycetota bacterium]